MSEYEQDLSPDPVRLRIISTQWGIKNEPLCRGCAEEEERYKHNILIKETGLLSE